MNFHFLILAFFFATPPFKQIQTVKMNKYLLEKYNMEGSDMRYSDKEDPTLYIPIHKKFAVLQQLNSDQVSLLEKIEKIRCDYRHIVYVDGNEIKRYSAYAGGLMDQWNAEARADAAEASAEDAVEDDVWNQ